MRPPLKSFPNAPKNTRSYSLLLAKMQDSFETNPGCPLDSVQASILGEDSGFQIEQRVHARGDTRRTGSVKYIGPVEGYSGIWVGVDWDDGNGKHDGTINGVRHFVSKGNISGSFVRPQNLAGGIPLLEALNLRYHGDYTKEEEEEMYVLSVRNKRVNIQLVGKNKVQEKLSRFEELRAASVSYLGVSSIGPRHQISSVVPNLKELDLTGNLLTKWQDVTSICEELPALEVLNLANNSMEHGITELPLLKNIRIFVLNGCGISWQQVEILEQSLPAIEELHLMANKLKTITREPSSQAVTFVQGFEHLRLLNLEGNCIESWDEIVKLSQLKSLKELHLNKNNLERIYYPVSGRQGSISGCELEKKCIMPFQNLRCLLLGGNNIVDLESVDSLNFFPSLMDIRFSDNPISDPGRGKIPRFVFVARLAKVQILNGSEVSARERKESEIRYVRFVMAKLQSDDPTVIRQLHPRFYDLKELHGIEDEKPMTARVGGQKMASGLLDVTLKCVGPSIGEKASMIKKLPATTTVGKLKFLCESLFNIKSIKPELFLQEEGSPLPQLLDDEMISLMELGIGSGSTILVSEET
ncbi:tubulin-folding cofactor E [Aristolochia californica]|uniref:tubulin-folding cofactor E n=1 Tax=Aristolochia californica TaxID=171875 RepID=UPI0035E1B3A4